MTPKLIITNHAYRRLSEWGSNTNWEVEVRAALNGHNVDIQTVSGCLVGEIWLQRANGEQEVAVIKG